MNNRTYSRYLEAKKTIDERSISQHVWQGFISNLDLKAGSQKLHILDIGAGTGSALIRLVKALRPSEVSYTAVDIEKEHLDVLIDNMRDLVGEVDGGVGETDDGFVFLTATGVKVEVKIVVKDAINFIQSLSAYSYDAVIAQAILDLLDVDYFLELLEKVTVKQGLYYFPINFDGMTTFLPSYDPVLDKKIEQIYHASMVKGGVDRSQTGRRLLLSLMNADKRIKEAGSSDWVVLPGDNKSYSGDEAYFLKHILFFVRNELIKSGEMSATAIEDWYTFRLKQIDRGELIYIAHQLDVLAVNS